MTYSKKFTLRLDGLLSASYLLVPPTYHYSFFFIDFSMIRMIVFLETCKMFPYYNKIMYSNTVI